MNKFIWGEQLSVALCIGRLLAKLYYVLNWIFMPNLITWFWFRNFCNLFEEVVSDQCLMSGVFPNEWCNVGLGGANWLIKQLLLWKISLILQKCYLFLKKKKYSMSWNSIIFHLAKASHDLDYLCQCFVYYAYIIKKTD